MASRRRSTDDDATEATRAFLTGVAAGGDVFDLVAQLAPLHPRHNTFPGEVFLRLGADALRAVGVTPAEPLSHEGLLARHLSECEFRGRDQRKIQYALLATAALHGGVEPDLLEEVVWWGTDDFWEYAAYATITYLRAAAERKAVPVRQLCEELGDARGVVLGDAQTSR